MDTYQLKTFTLKLHMILWIKRNAITVTTPSITMSRFYSESVHPTHFWPTVACAHIVSPSAFRDVRRRVTPPFIPSSVTFIVTSPDCLHYSTLSCLDTLFSRFFSGDCDGRAVSCCLCWGRPHTFSSLND